MYKYYIFLVKKEIKKLYVDYETELYILLKKLKDSDNLQLSISVYYQLFECFNTDFIKGYLDNKINIKHKKNKYLFLNDKCIEKTLIEVNPSCIVILSNMEKPIIFKILKYLYNDLFICEFDKNIYLFLK